MPRARSIGGSPAKKSGKSPARHTTPRKKSKTPSRRGAKSPAPKRARSRSVSKSRATTPKKSAARRTPSRKQSPSKSPKSPGSPKASPKRQTPRGRPRSRSSSQSSKASTRRTPTIGQKAQHVARVIEHKVVPPVVSAASNIRSRASRAVRDFTGGNTQVTSSGSRSRAPGQSIWYRVRNSRVANYVRAIPRRFRWANAKRSLKKNWRRIALLAVLGVTAYYSYHNKKAIEKALNEQYNRLSALVQQQKESTFSKYFSG